DKIFGLNYVLLFLFNASVTWVIAYASVKTSFTVIIEAGFLTTSICIGLIWFAFAKNKERAEKKKNNNDDMKKYDDEFDLCQHVPYTFGPLCGIACMLGVLFGFEMKLLYCIIGVCVFSFYIVTDVTLMIAGESLY
uniref:hypothetical protein n=1 Tax=Serratia quinivorans TaxID=137545 RepID=UPI0035C6DFC1